ncbi:MAG TPA: protein kinase, partial [Kofleriaceae bacterium]|nr:protein kinase [Kofleriaceae bacterium]
MEALRERFGKYHVLEKIAQGGMAEVYKVKTVGIAGFEKIQALKRILPHSAREGRFIRSFIDEARIAVELTHRNIVQVFDFGKADGELFLAMELIEGRDLRTALAQATARSVPCPIAVAAYIIAEVAAGLDYAHRKTDGYGGALGIVHCDVSPSNVMLSTEGYVKILDFGIARATFASALERRRLRGKPRYMAPEQTLGEPPTAAADVFALGIIAWELFTGLALYRGADLKAILEAVRRTDPPRIDRVNPEVPRQIVDAVAVALDREVGRRGTAADLGAACTRLGMQAGARGVSGWLAALDAHPSGRELSWPKDPESVSVQRRSGSRPAVFPLPDDAPPARQSTASLTASVIAPAPPAHELGEGTPGPRLIEPTVALEPDNTTSKVAKFESDGTSTQSRPFERATATGASYQRFGDRDPTASLSVAQRFAGEATASATAPHREPTATATSAQWGPERTVAGVAKLADALPEVVARASTEADPEPPGRASRPSYATLQLGPGSRPSALRFDDEQTQFAPAMVVEPAVEPEPEPAPDDFGDEPIDDDLPALAAGVLAERRRTVVVAGQLEGAARELLRPIAKSVGELAYQRGGVVLALHDEGLIVAFGLEVAAEDDVAIAMGWALDATALARDAGTSLRVGARAGVITSHDASRIPSDAIDEARALAREAAPERPLFVGAAGRITSGLYALREVPAPRRIGRRSKVIEVVGPRGFDERDRARLERRGKFVGRTAQLAELDMWYQRAIAADRRLTALITGAAGAGKSRLVAEHVARRTAASPDLLVLMTAANPASHHAPFALVIDLYQAALGLAPARGRSARAQLVHRLLHVMHEAGAPDERARAVASDLDRAMELRDGASLGAPEVADLRPRISAGLAAFRAALSARHRRPLLTVIEDIHQGDSPSLEVMRHTLAVPVRGAELLVLTARPDGPAPPAVDVAIAVGDLVGGELRQLIVDRLGGAATPLNIAAVIARGGGNPLFVEELAQAVRDAGPDAENVPASARDVVAARADRLSGKARTALRYAAVIGGAVRARLLEELLGAEAPRRPADEELSGPDESSAAALDELVEAGFLVRPAEGELQFARGLVREVVYEALPARAQRDMHARVGRLLASRFFAGRDEPPAAIADHLERGGEIAGAAAFWLRAGRLALAAFDADAAVLHFTRTLALERELGATPPTAPSRARRREALAGRDDAHRLTGDVMSDPGDL